MSIVSGLGVDKIVQISHFQREVKQALNTPFCGPIEACQHTTEIEGARTANP